MGKEELPGAVGTALAMPSEGTELTIDAAGIPWRVLAWGNPGATPVLIVHGVTSTARTWWSVGPALAAAGYRVLAPDLPGHGRTGHWNGHHRFADLATDLAAFVREAGIARPDLRVVGHSWGAMVAAELPAAGIVPARLVLIDPPAIPLAAIAAMLEDPVERPYDDLDEAIARIASANPTWPRDEVFVKAEGLTQFDEGAVRAVLTQNGDWDGGLRAIAAPAAADVPIWLIRGDPAYGGLVPDEAVPALAARMGRARVVTIAGAPHSPHRTHTAAVVAALLRALAD